MTRTRAWIAGARPRTLGASVIPVLAGTAAARSPSPVRATLALATAAGLQVGVNYLNDYFDGVGGVDTSERQGPLRLTASGIFPPQAVRRAGLRALGLAAVAGATLAIMVDARLLVAGALFLLAAAGYSGGPRPFASYGLGEIVVFATFGIGAVCGTAYVHDLTVPAPAWWCAVPLGLLASALMLVNNIRDVRTDQAAGKRTLAVRLGVRRARLLYRLLLAGALGVPLGAAFGGELPARTMLVLITIPLVIRCVRGVTAQGRALVPVLQATAALHAATGIILAWAVWHA